MRFKKRICLLLIFLLLEVISFGCSSPQADEKMVDHSISEEKNMQNSIKIQMIHFDKSFYHPGESIHLMLDIENDDGKKSVILHYEIRAVAQLVIGKEFEITLEKGINEIQLDIVLDLPAPHGYGLDIWIESADSEQIAELSSGFDVLNKWTETPRYGFLTNFSPNRQDIVTTIQALSDYHINGLQFYDWMYRHDQFLTTQDPYLDPLGRELSIQTVNKLIESAHQFNIAAMPYTAIYAASIPFSQDHPEMALYDRNGNPLMFGDNFLAYMSTKADSPWLDHLMTQFKAILQNTDFDGIHLDQYGDPKVGYDADGNEFDLAISLADTIDLTKEVVEEERKDGTVIFNAVNNWPIETVAPSNQDLVYIEVWSPYNWFSDIATLIIEAQELGDGKPVVIAAYLDPSYSHNLLLLDAVIFASGASHIELGEDAALLAEAYFPNYRHPSQETSAKLRTYYDFMVRYQDVIGPRTKDVTSKFSKNIVLEGYDSSQSLQTNKIMLVIRGEESFTAINLINFVGVEQAEWKQEIIDAPLHVEDLPVHVETGERKIKRVLFATPDSESIQFQELEFVSGANGEVTIFVPDLYYWDLILIEWEE